MPTEREASEPSRLPALNCGWAVVWKNGRVISRHASVRRHGSPLSWLCVTRNGSVTGSGDGRLTDIIEEELACILADR